MPARGHDRYAEGGEGEGVRTPASSAKPMGIERSITSRTMLKNNLIYKAIKRSIELIWMFLFARKAMKGLNHVLLNLVHKSLGINNYQSNAISGERNWLRYVLRNHNPTIVFDIGAHTGQYTKELRAAGYNGLIYLFEPHPNTFAKLQIEQGHIENNLLFNIGFSSQSGDALIFDYDLIQEEPGSVHASLYRSVMTDIHKSPSIRERKVALRTLDEFVEAEKIDRISLLKIDTEGSEYPILLGAKKIIEEGRVEIIQFEFGEMNVVSRVFFKDFYDLLNPFYHIYRLLPGSLLPIKEYSAKYHEIFSYQNLVCIKKSQ